MLHTNNIFKEILNNIYELEIGKLEIPILFNDIMIPTQNDYLCAYFEDEYFLNVRYKGNDIDVACDINKLKTKPEYVARCIMYGFMKIIKSLNQKNESKMRKKIITLTETKLRGIIHESITDILSENSDRFSKAMKKLFYIVDDFGEIGEDIRETIIYWFGADNPENEEDYWYFIYNKSGMYYLLRRLMNYDFFWVTKNGKIDIQNANEPHIARLIAPFVTPEMCIQAANSF